MDGVCVDVDGVQMGGLGGLIVASLGRLAQCIMFRFEIHRTHSI